MINNEPNFDFIARPYRWLEYLTFGPYLERCRFHFVENLGDRCRALILGDGDGRFTARLLAINPRITVDAVDCSAAMLQLLTGRVSRLGSSAENRLRALKMDVRYLQLRWEEQAYDLIVTHFFLDCLSEDDLATLLDKIGHRVGSDSLWLVSEFAIPTERPNSWVASLALAGLYRAFRMLTGLRVGQLPDYSRLFQQAGFSRIERKIHLGGLLVSELWKLNANPSAAGGARRPTF